MRFGFGLTSRGTAAAPFSAAAFVSRKSASDMVTPASNWRVGNAVAHGRRVPFLPDGKATPVFFLHIPRTSGASLISFLRKLYGADGVVEGAEHLVSDVLSGRRDPVRTDCLTGAVPLMRWEMYRDADQFKRVTILRDPWARLVSHINRLAVLGPESAGPEGSFARLMAAEVAEADFTSRAGLERLRRRMQPSEGGFDNLQTRMLLTGSMSSLVKPLTGRDVARAVSNLAGFGLVGFCEDQVGLQRGLMRLTGKDSNPAGLFEGTGKAAVLSPRNDLAREVLEPWFAHDQELLAAAKTMVAARQV